MVGVARIELATPAMSTKIYTHFQPHFSFYVSKTAARLPYTTVRHTLLRTNHAQAECYAGEHRRELCIAKFNKKVNVTNH